MNGEWSEEQILRKFLDTFDTRGSEDGTVNFIKQNSLKKKTKYLKFNLTFLKRSQEMNS